MKAIRTTAPVAVFLLGVALLLPLACSDDPVQPQNKPVAGPANLTQKWHVLSNIETAYNKRDITIYDQLLDDSFVFYLSPGDVGGDMPDQWGRVEEILYTSRMFDPNYNGQHRCTELSMDLVLPDEKNTIQWVAFTPAGLPDQTWYKTMVYYHFRLETEPSTTYESVAGARAEFTVRNAGTDEAPHWQLVEMHDQPAH